MDKFLIVAAPVADIRRKPVDAISGYTLDDQQETQVLYNEILIYRDEIEDWYYVEAIEQRKFTDKNIWQGYPGWIRKEYTTTIDAPFEFNAIIKNRTAHILKSPEKEEVLLTVSMGTRVKVRDLTLPEVGQRGKKKDKAIVVRREDYCQVQLADQRSGWIKQSDLQEAKYQLNEAGLRRNILKTAKLFLGVSYLWGGRSMDVPAFERGARSVERGVKTSLERPAWGVDNGVSRTNAGLSAIRYPLNAILTGVDCSGLTSLVYRVNNIDIPRDAHEQWMVSEKITAHQLKPGDLIFISAEGKHYSIIHVMLNMGKENFIEAADTGGTVKVSTFIEKFGKDLPWLAGRSFLIDDKKIYLGRLIPRRNAKY